ncbi:MAG: hypothetical protein U1F52_13440 [Burkholderiales bacterium]
MTFHSTFPAGRRIRHRVPAGSLIAGILFATLSGAAQAVVTMEVAWTDPKCDFIVTKNEAGHGIALRMTEFKLEAGDRLEGALEAVGYIRKIAKISTEESGMMQIRKYGIRRKVAFDLIYDWSRHCNPPEE